jgi:protein-disulfide isomerase
VSFVSFVSCVLRTGEMPAGGAHRGAPGSLSWGVSQRNRDRGGGRDSGRAPSRDGQRTARVRLREQREREARRQRRNRALIAAGAVLGVLAVVGGVAALVTHGGDDEAGRASAAPAGAAGAQGLAIPSGAAGAPATLTVYEDFRCPACGYFEKTYRDTLHRLQDSGQVKVEYHLVRIIDGNLRGTGSLNAANAAACAQDQGRFRAYHDVLYENQPKETQDRFASKHHLVQLAEKVDGLRTDAFTRCVNSGRHDAWVERSNADFGGSGYNATPTILLNGSDVYAGAKNPLTPAALARKVTQAAKAGKPASAPVTAAPSP